MPNRLVPPPPPITPSIVAPGSMPQGVDSDSLIAEEIYNKIAPPAQTAPAQDEDSAAAEEIYKQIAPPQQAQSMPLPTPIPNQPKPQTSLPKSAAQPKPVVSRAQPATAAAPTTAVQKPPTVMQQAAGDVMKGVDNFVGQGLKAAQSVPILNQFIQQSHANSADVKKNPFEAAASTIAAAPAGALGFIDDLINIPAAQQGLGAPAHLREGYLGLPGIKRMTEAYPGAAATGEFGGAAGVPLGVPLGPLKAIKNPVVRGAVHGAVAGGAFGTISSGGQQAKKGERPNLGKALREGGLPGAALGAVAGGATGGTAGKLTFKAKSKAPEGKLPETAAPAPNAETGEAIIKLHDGSSMTPVQAVENLNHEGVPEHTKAEILEQLNAHHDEIAGAAREAKKDVHAQIAKPEEGLKPAQPAMPLEPTKGTAPEPVIIDAPNDSKNAAEPESHDYSSMSDHDLTNLMESGDDGALTEFLNRAEQSPAQPLTLEQFTAQRNKNSAPMGWADRGKAYTPKQGLQAQYEIYLRDFNKAPQNKPISEPPGAGELAPLQSPPAEAIEQPKTALGANPHDATTDGALNFSPDESTPQIAETKPEATAGANIYQYRKTAKGYEVYNESTGDVAKKNWSEAKTKEYVDGLNQKLSENPDFGRTQGRRSSVAMEKGTSDTRQAIVGAGQPLPETATPTVRAGLDSIAEAKHSYDELRAKSESAYDALREDLGKPASIGFKKSNKYNKQVEEEFLQLGKDKPDQLSFEVQNSVKLKPEPYQFKPGMTDAEKGAEVLDLMKRANEAKTALSNAKATTESELRAGIDNGVYPNSINIKHSKGTVNIRLKPKQGTQLGEDMAAALDAPSEQYQARNQTAVKTWLKEPKQADATYQANANSTRPVKAKGIRSQSGAINLGLKKPAATQQQAPAPAAAAVAQGAHQSKKIAAWANSLHYTTRLFTLRRSLDVARERSATIHNAVWESIAKETLQGRGIKFEPEHEPLINDSLRMEPGDILTGQNGLNVLDAKQLNYLATRRAIRQATGKGIKTEREAWLKEYGDNTNKMPNAVRHNYEVFKQLEEAFTGRGGKADTGEFGAVGVITGGMYDYIFKWNPAYHSLNLFDPLVVGSSRAGIQRVMAAKMVQQTDPTVRNFLNGVESKSPVDQLRAETRIKTAESEFIEPDWSTTLVKNVANLQGKLPDLPSEKWNFNDSLGAGLIMRGDQIKHPGGGVKYLQDLAGGKLSQDEMVRAMVDGLQVADDITGAGALGLNKDPVQRTPMMKYLTQFTSQPYRVARLMKEYGKAGEYDKIATFLAATALVSGRATLPKEADLLKFIPNKEVRKAFFAIEDFLDTMNVVDDIPVIGRDLTDKMRYSIFPILGGVQTNMLLDSFEKTLSDVVGLKLDKLGESAIWAALSAFLGGGGLEMGRINREAGNAANGDKQVYAPHPSPYGGNLRPIGKKSFKALTGRPYNAGDALGNMILPGKSPIEGRYVKEAQRKRLDK